LKKSEKADWTAETGAAEHWLLKHIMIYLITLALFLL
jgi:hypothetical protein